MQWEAEARERIGHGWRGGRKTGVNDKPRYTKLARADARLCGREVVQWEAEACERKKAWVARRARSRENFAYYEQPLG